ncbi:hypothetical protein [Ferrimonas balearica]|uniref:hypothetical protein n=1 Tax=Ferrimonas balearica TaxID=44012 RepID=UPI001C9968EC|nr:hypothetical protein [Ferrimonas balearica]MBY5992196.1 hypothetical protein [Ferrimonas balearica]
MKGITLLAALLASTSALAADPLVYRCNHGNAERLIEVRYPAEAPLPCEVHYTKAEGSQMLWSAANTAGYCEQRAENFVEKQRGWGWSCELEAVEPAPATEPEAQVE